MSVLISTYNGVSDLQLFLQSLKNVKTDGHEFEYIVRDDNSSDETCKFIEDNFPHARLIQGKENLGFVKSNNLAYKYATGEVICCLNQDTILKESFFQEALTTLQTSPGCVGISPNMFMPWVLDLGKFNRCNIEELPAFEYQISEYGFIQYVEVEKKERITNFLTGGAFFLKRSVLDERETLFDENIEAYCEDTELSMRVMERRGKIVFSPKAVVYHNQIPKKVNSFKGLMKLLKITWNRFSLFTRKLSPVEFSKKFPRFIYGIVKKTEHLGLSASAKSIAYPASYCVAILFTFFFPYWLFKVCMFSLKQSGSVMHSIKDNNE